MHFPGEPGWDTAKCGEARVSLYTSSNCEFMNASWSSTVIQDTAGAVIPFDPYIPVIPRIRSLRFTTPFNPPTTICPFIQFGFYGEGGACAGFTYTSPGKNFPACVSFGGASVVGYNGVTMLGTVPEHLIERARVKGNIMSA